MGVIKTWSSEDLINSLMPATVALHLSEETRALGLITHIEFIILHLIIHGLWEQVQSSESSVDWNRGRDGQHANQVRKPVKNI